MSKQGVVLYLHVHQPFRVRKYSVFDTANKSDYFNEVEDASCADNKQIFKKVAEKSYLPMNKVLLNLLNENPEFKLSLSITGTFIEQALLWSPDVIDSFKRLIDTGRVEVLAETYYHSLAFFYDKAEFEDQVDLHRRTIKNIFNVETKVFRNTELAYNDSLAKWADGYGFKGIIAEGWEKAIQYRSPNYVYSPKDTQNIGLLLKNYHLSDDLAFRFGNKSWSGWPLTHEKFVSWVNASINDEQIVNLFMDYETFGEHQWEDTGIFEFFAKFVEKWLTEENKTFYTVSEALDAFRPVGEISMPNTVSWADAERDLTAWNGNIMQQEALRYLYSLKEDIIRTNDVKLIDDWRKLQTSDHFYYMCTKWHTDGDVHAYFSPYDSPYDAFLYYINVIRDLRYRLHHDHHIGGLNG